MGAAARDVRATRLPDDQPARRWRKTPAEVKADLIQLLEHFRRQHAADPAEVIEDIFVTIGALLTGFCRPGGELDGAGDEAPARRARPT